VLSLASTAWLTDTYAPFGPHTRGCRWRGGSCSEHGCPECAAGDRANDGCATCWGLLRPIEFPGCINGEFCLVCTTCLPERRCNCVVPICRWCLQCSAHARFGDLECGASSCDHSWWEPIGGWTT